MFKIILVLSLFSYSGHAHDDHDTHGQDDAFARMEEIQKQMMKRMEKVFQGGRASLDASLFVDDDEFKALQENLEIQQYEDKNYKYVKINVDGLSKDNLKIDIKNGLIALKGEVKKIEEVDKEGSKSLSTYRSSFSRAFPVPQGVDESSVKIEQAGESILIKFPKKVI